MSGKRRPVQLTENQENRPSLTATWQSVISLALVIHLLCIAICLFSVLPASSLMRRALAAVSPYIQLMNFDLDYTPYYLTLDTLNDRNFDLYQEMSYRIEILPEGKDAEDDEQWVVLGEEYSHGREAYKRFLRLAETMSLYTEENNDRPEMLGRLAQNVGRYSLRELDIQPQKIRLRIHTPAPRQHYLMRPLNGPPVDPNDARYFRTLYTALVIGTEGDSIHVIREVPKGQAAGPNQANSQNPPPSAQQ